ncbi:hypothetical protein, partial [uncultured Intestinimonas sp.]|uniref:hypothetical protein n=1 Tax=uncultured Intestinimonas sp. TaxID=1689265 RepID=UPI0025CBE107
GVLYRIDLDFRRIRHLLDAHKHVHFWFPPISVFGAGQSPSPWRFSSSDPWKWVHLSKAIFPKYHHIPGSLECQSKKCSQYQLCIKNILQFQYTLPFQAKKICKNWNFCFSEHGGNFLLYITDLSW